MKLNELKNILSTQKLNIENWFEAAKDKYKFQPPLFSSLDIRNAGFKSGHVDANLFPAGFNNLSETARTTATQEIKNYLSIHFPDVKKILLIPENFTRNLKYLDNLHALKKFISDTGFEVLIGSPYISISERHEKPHYLHIFSLKRNGDLICTDNDWYPDLLILNNDLTDGLPALLTGLKQPIAPNPFYGWHTRRKSTHFKAYAEIVADFVQEFKFDSWLISSIFTKCDGVNFKQKIGFEKLALAVEEIIQKTAIKYSQYGIKQEPYAYIKSDLGTYGMGIIAVKNVGELLTLNKKNRHSLHAVKYGMQNEELIIQEGIPTIELYNDHSAETMSYLVNGKIVQSLYRVNSLKDSLTNLNSRGMTIEIRNGDHDDIIISTIAQLASIAISIEKNDLIKTSKLNE